MADTVRSLAALQALTADNFTHNITPQILRDMLVSVFSTGSYAAQSVAYVVAASDAPVDVIATADYTCDGVADDVQINAALAALPSFGGTVHLIGTFIIADTIRVSLGNTLLSFDGGATLKWTSVPASRPLLHIVASKVDVFNPRTQGSGAKGNGIGILLAGGQTYLTGAIAGALAGGTVSVVSTSAFAASGTFCARGISYTYTGITATTFTGVTGGSASDTFGIGESIGLPADIGCHDVSIYSPECINSSEGVTFGIIEGQSTGDCAIFGGTIHGCTTGIMSRGFTNRAFAVRIYSCTIAVDVSNERTSAKFEGYGLTLSQWTGQAIRVRGGCGSTFETTWMEHTGSGTPTEAVLIGGHTSLSDKTSREALGVRFEGTTKVTLSGELYVFRMYNARDFFVEDLTISTNGDSPTGGVLRLESTLTGSNNRIKRIALSPGHSSLNTFADTPPGVSTQAYPPTISGTAGTGGEGIIEQHYDVESTPNGTTIGGVCTPHPTAYATIYKVQNGTKTTYFAKSPKGHILSFGADSATNNNLPASLTAGETPGNTHTSGLKTVMDAVKGSNRHIHFSADTFDFGFNRTVVLSTYNDLTITGDGIDATIIQNYVCGTQDLEPIDTTLATRFTIRDITFAAGGELNNGGTAGSSADCIDLDQGVDCLVERVKIIASRDRAIIIDGKDSGVADQSAAYNNVIRDCIIDGTPDAAPSAPSGAVAASGTLTAQAYTYKMTVCDANYRESLGSAASGAVNPSGVQKITVTLATGVAGTVCRKLYRSSAAQPTYQLVYTIFDNTTTTYVDDIADATLVAATGTTGSGNTELPAFSTIGGNGIELLGAHRNSIRDNTIICTGGDGIAMNRGATIVVNSSYNLVDGNKIRATNGVGIRIFGGIKNLVFKNRISNSGTAASNKQAILVTSTATGTTEDNRVENNVCWDDQAVKTQTYGVQVTSTASIPTRTIVKDNTLRDNKTNGITDAGSATEISGNSGYVTEAYGTDSITSGQTTKAVTHGLAVTPTRIFITFREAGTADYGRFWVDTIGGTTFKLNVTVDPGASNLDFAWEAKI